MTLTNKHLKVRKNFAFSLSILIGFFLFESIICNARGNEICTTNPTSSFVVNVKDKGAKGDGIANDTAVIQAAINQVFGTGGTVLVPNGTYMIDAITSIQVKSDMTLQFSTGAVFKAFPNGSPGYSVIKITNASNINIIGGTLIGERDKHFKSSGEWGMGLNLSGVRNIMIKDLTAKNFWGDGFYIGGASKNVKLCSVVAESNRRQGMSIISVDGMIVINSAFKNTGGTAPQAGIDLEPNENDIVNNVQILNSQFSDNKGYGILFAQVSKNSDIKNVTIKGNTISTNLSGGIALINTSNHQIINNFLKDNSGFGIHLYRQAKGSTITGNILIGKNIIMDESGNKVFDNSIN